MCAVARIDCFFNPSWSRFIRLDTFDQFCGEWIAPSSPLGFVFARVLAWVISADGFQRADNVERATRRNSIRLVVRGLTDPTFNGELRRKT